MSRSGSGTPWVSSAADNASGVMSCGLIVPSRHALGQPPRGPGDFGPRSVVEGDLQVERGIVGGERDRLVDEGQQLRIDAVALADHADAHAVLMQLGQIPAG